MTPGKRPDGIIVRGMIGEGVGGVAAGQQMKPGWQEKAERMKLSIVIPAFNEEKELPACLASVKEALAALAAQGWQEYVWLGFNSRPKAVELVRSALPRRGQPP